jgi:hypothetical protein
MSVRNKLEVPLELTDHVSRSARFALLPPRLLSCRQRGTMAVLALGILLFVSLSILLLILIVRSNAASLRDRSERSLRISSLLAFHGSGAEKAVLE